jgi:hypothetical protein
MPVAPGWSRERSVYVASNSRADLVTAWQVVRDAFGDHDAPSSLPGATVGYPGQLVEVEAVGSAAADWSRPPIGAHDRVANVLSRCDACVIIIWIHFSVLLLIL